MTILSFLESAILQFVTFTTDYVIIMYEYFLGILWLLIVTMTQTQSIK